MGVSSTPWTINAEIYPIHVIGTASSLSTTTNWVTNAFVASVFLITTKTVVGQIITFSILALFALACLIFVYFKVPETANKEINEILLEILGDNYKGLECEGTETEGDN